MGNDLVKNYYDACYKDYQRIWHLDKCMSMHFGFWDEKTTCLKDALIKENQLLAEMVNIKASDKVLDAGCGVGGSAIYLAKNIGCFATGITITPSQIDIAQQNAKKHHVSDKTEFLLRDYTRTSFDDESFDVVWAIESICHVGNSPSFQKEAFRILKPGGRLIVADGFQSKKHLSKKEQKQLKNSFIGWGVESLASEDVFHLNIENEGFKNIIEKDVTKMVKKSSRRLYLLSFPAFIVDFIERLLKKRGSVERGNVTSAYYQHVSLIKGLWRYKIYMAEKP